MLLVHQVGTVKIGEVVRYTLTYVPSQDRILPSPERLHLRIRNTCALVLRGAFVHGPYNLACCAYPATFNPNERFQNPRRYGVPEFEPMVKAASSWECDLLVPDTVRQGAGAAAGASSSSTPTAADGAGPGGSGAHFGKGPEHDGESVSWIIEVSAQVIFSSSAAVSFELVVARDKKSLDLTSAGGGAPAGARPGKVSDHQPVPEGRQGPGPGRPHHLARKNDSVHPKGVYSRAIRLKVEDTGVLWNTPPLPRWQDGRGEQTAMPASELLVKDGKPVPRPDRVKQKQKKIHLVVLSHGLHSNLGSDMLFLKESIDTAVRKAKVDAKRRRAKERAEERAEKGAPTASGESLGAEDQGHGKSPNGTHDIEPSEKEEEAARSTNSAQPEDEAARDQEEEDDDDDEEVIVRGFSGNATRTEKGIKYLGKRLARYILAMTYPDQPYLPPSSKASWASLWADASAADSKHSHGDSKHSHGGSKHSHGDSKHSHGEPTAADKACAEDAESRPFRITSISFIGHSLGGLIQTYAIAYCQKHSPDIFDLIKPVNFIALATPFLGLGNENPLYVRFALDSGLVGRTGQDLGLAWRAPTLARSGFDALMSNLGDMAHKKFKGEHHPESKPLLRILPTGPAHAALKKFRNRTVYSNVVNDGIVPLRTSCLLFLDWQGLGRVEKARRDAGLVGTAIGFGWAELTGANLLTTRRPQLTLNDEDEDRESGATTPLQGESHVVPQPSQDAMLEDDRQSLMAVSINVPYREDSEQSGTDSTTSTLSSFFSSLFRSSDGSRSPTGMPKSPSTSTTATSMTTFHSSKQSLIYRRSQTIKSESSASGVSSSSTRRSRVTTGSEYDEGSEPGGGGGFDGSSGFAPPRTTLFESAHDLINPQVPDMQYLLDPAKRPRTIFHDRVYHPEDIPPLPLKRRGTGSRGVLRKGTGKTEGTNSGATTPTTSGNPSQQSEGQDSLTGAISMSPTAINSTNTNFNDSNAAKPYPRPSAPSSPVRDASVDASSIRVEEKIARAYHRDLSWRKVLVKLEPDAHNNIIVRRMFANAFGWPVVHHLVEAHFSDSATARASDEAEGSGERAKGVGAPPDEHGGETKAGAESVGLEGPGEEKDVVVGDGESMAGVHRTDSEDREAEDAVPELPTTPSMTAQTPACSSLNAPADDGGRGTSPQRQQHHHLQSSSPRRAIVRADSMTWSERDWVDSENDSDTDILGSPATPTAKGKAAAGAREHGASSSSGGAAGADAAGGWNWTEKIVGKKPGTHRTRGGKAAASGEPRGDGPEGPKLKLKTT